ncbi:MAG TPA: ATP-binding protein [Gemmatimonadaceae bacterium]|jgi:signal transduction histidine kinase
MTTESFESFPTSAASFVAIAPSAGAIDAEALRCVQIFADLRPDELAWIAANTERVELAPRQLLLVSGQPAEWMFIGIQGTVEVRREQLGSNVPAYVFHAGDIAGVIPFSRMKQFVGNGRAATHAIVGRFPRALFPELLQRIPVLAPRFVAFLADRVRDATRREAQIERLLALGKLSAGIAHELNNPVSAILGSFADAGRRLRQRGELVVELVRCGASPDALMRLEELRRSVGPERRTIDPLTRSDNIETMDAWLREVGLTDSWAYAATFVDAGFDASALSRAMTGMPDAAQSPALRWLESGLALEALFTSVEHAGTRVAEIVDAVKGYTNRDRGRDMSEVDLRQGLDATIALFASRFRERGATLTRELDVQLPRMRAYPGDLNQAWSHLIDNALDAVAPLGEKGRVVIRASRDDGWVQVEVRDNGPGIPEALQERVFEPFFTTKEPGHGTGLGLDITRRIVTDLHGGELTLESKPGDTRFIARLPLTTVATLGV